GSNRGTYPPISATVLKPSSATERHSPLPAYAPTLRIALGYGTPAFHGFTAFAQGEAVAVTGPADYSDPTRPPQNRPDRPAILDLKSLEISQGYVTWTHSIDRTNLVLRV